MSKLLLPLICVTFTTLVLKFMLNWRHKKKINNLSEDRCFQYYHQCTFLDIKQFNCRKHIIDGRECSEECAYVYQQQLVSFISSAKISICMCMYILTLKDIIFAMINASKRGVKVRVITDNIMLKTDVMQKNFGRLEKNRIPYKTQPSDTSLMHHKFCLIDKENPELSKLLFGSLNFTTQALTKNFENFIVTNNQQIVGTFDEEFESLWAAF